MGHVILYGIVGFIFFEFLLSRFLEYLNKKTWDLPLPPEAEGLYNQKDFEKAKAYYHSKDQLGWFSSAVSWLGMTIMLLCGGFSLLDAWVRSKTEDPVLMSLLFFAAIGLASLIISIPFSLYSTFVIEEKFGFNKSTFKTWFTDLIKSAILSSIVAGALLALITWFSEFMGHWFWLIAWLSVSGVSIFFAIFYTSLLLPLFNKLSPLQEGALRSAIEHYCMKAGFPLAKILVMDGSKRSSKANAFFSGLGPKKTIVLYDTLINTQSEVEITAVLAHEVGHYKRRHIYKGLAMSLFSSAFMFFIFGLLNHSQLLADVLDTPKSFHIALIVFGMLYSPVSLILGPFSNWLSRKHEFEADSFAKESFGGEALCSSLRKLSVSHLSNPQPHPWYVFFHYSHPPLLERLKALSK